MQAIVILFVLFCNAVPVHVSAAAELLCQELTAEKYTDSSYSERLENDTEIIIAGDLPQDASVKVYPVDYTIADLRTVAAYDITIFAADGETVYEPEEGSVRVTFRMPQLSDIADDQLEVYHVSENGSEQKVDALTAEGDSLTFEAESFSVYIIIDHEGSEEIVTPRIEFHFLSNEYAETTLLNNTAAYIADPYQFRNKGLGSDGSLGIQTSQILQDGEALEPIENPPNTPAEYDEDGITVLTPAAYFYGWYQVTPVSVDSTAGTVTYQWRNEPQLFEFEKPVSIDGLDAGMLSWSAAGISQTTQADESGCAHVYLAPLYSNYYFVNFHLNTDFEESVTSSTLLTRRLIALGANHQAAVRIGNIQAPSPDAKHLVFTGWQTVDSDGVQTEKYITLDENGNEIIHGGADGYYITCGEADVDLYPVFNEARWIHFNSGVGAVYVPSEYRLTNDDGTGTSFTKLRVSARNGFNFMGWYANVPTNGNGEPDFSQGIQITDSQGNMVTDDVAVRNGGGELMYEVRNGAFYVYKALPATDEQDGVTLRARWEEKQDSSYTVIIWAQKITDDKNAADADKKYDYVDSYAVENVRSGLTLEDITPYLKSQGYIKEGANQKFEGFTYRTARMNTAAVAGDGNTVVNIYYDRNLQIINFYYTNAHAPAGAGTGYTYTVTESDDGTQFGIVNDEFVQLTRRTAGQNTVWKYRYDYTETTTGSDQYGIVNNEYVKLTRTLSWGGYSYSYGGTTYNGTRYQRSNNNSDVYDGVRYVKSGNSFVETTASNGTQYGKDARGAFVELTASSANVYKWYYNNEEYTGQRFTRANNTSYKMVTWTGLYGQTFAMNGYSWDDVSSYRWKDTTGTIQTFLDSFIQEINPYTLTDQNTSPGSSEIYHYRQQLDGSYTIDDREVAHGSGGTFNFSDKFTGFKVAAYSSPNFSAAASGRIAVSAGGSASVYPLHVYHSRNAYPLTFDVNYPDDINASYPNGKALNKEVTVLFDAPLSKYGKNGSDYYDLENYNPDHYVFSGWYEDKTGTVPFNFNSKMPAANKIIYAKWSKVRYLVEIDPNGAVIDHIDHTAEYVTARNEDTGATATYKTFMPYNGVHAVDQSTYFYADYNEEIGEYTVTRDYIEISDTKAEELGADKVYYYINTQFAKNGGKELPRDLRNAIYVTEENLAEYHRFYMDALAAYKAVSPDEYGDTEIITDFGIWKHYYVSDQKYAKISDVSSNQQYVSLGWFEVDENGETAAMPYDFTKPATEPVKLRALWRLDGGYKIAYIAEYRTASNVRINANLSRMFDPPLQATFADQARATVLSQPTGITADNVPTKEYIFRGWRVVSPRGNDTFIPLEAGVYYQSGDPFTVQAQYADQNSFIYMQAVYERTDVAYRRPEIANLTLDANGGFLTDGTSADPLSADMLLPWYERAVCTAATKLSGTSPATEYDQILFGNMQSNAAVHLYRYAADIKPEGKEKGTNYFLHPEGYMLLGFDKAPDENDFIASFPADSVISVQRTDNTTLYAVWEPMVYLNFENKTDSDITFALTSANSQTLYVVNEKTSFYDREKVEDNNHITVKAGEKLHLAIPFGADQDIRITGTNTLGVGYVLRTSSSLKGTGRNQTTANNGEVFTLNETLVTDENGIDVVFEAEQLGYALVMVDCDDPLHGRNTGIHEIDFASAAASDSYTIRETRASIGYIFRGWSDTDTAANIGEDPTPDYRVNGVEHATIENLEAFFSDPDKTEQVENPDGTITVVRRIYAVWAVNNQADIVYVYKDVPLPGSQTQEFEFTVSLSFERKNAGNSYTEFSYSEHVSIAHGEYFKIVSTYADANNRNVRQLTITKYNASDTQIGNPVTIGYSETKITNFTVRNMALSVTESDYAHYDTEISQLSSTAAQGFRLTEGQRSVNWTDMNTGGSVLFTNTRRTTDITIKKRLADPEQIAADKSFDFDLALLDANPDYTYTLPVTDFALQDGDSRVISGIPVGANLRITEAGDVSNYIVTAESAGAYPDADSESNIFRYAVPETADTVTFTNTLRSVKLKIYSVDENGAPYTSAIYQIAGLTGDLIPQQSGLFYSNDNLYNHTYVLTETWTSEGYVRLNTPVHITVSASGVTADHPDADVSFDPDTQTWIIRIVNHEYRMPAPTGFGGEKQPFVFLMLSMSSILAAAVFLRKRRAGDENAI